MLIDARQLKTGTVLQADICVVGGGAAGITMAREFNSSRSEVILLESGGFKYEEETQSLYDGPVDGGILTPNDNYLKASRLRFLGGSTNHWDGWCRPLDPFDFEPRAWVPMSGWPITRASLDPYYNRACKHIEISPFDYDPEALSDVGTGYLFEHGSPFRTSFFHISPPTRFGETYRQELTDAPQLRLYNWANVVDIETNEAGTAILSIKAATLSGVTFTVQAKQFVLAAGGIENARLLLAANSVHKTGIGNASDFVGRCFMEHPSFQPIGFVSIQGRKKTLNPYNVKRHPRLGNKIHGWLFPSRETQEKHSILNVAFSLHIDKVPLLADEVNDIATAIEGMRPGLKPPAAADSFFGSVAVVTEQVPNPDSRVTLSDQRDALGRPRCKLEWRLGDIDTASMRTAAELFGRELGRNSLGRFFFDIDKDRPWRRITNSAHHIGTTRISTDPKQGVVDANARVHGIENLYIASSSIFPTSGVSNPTLTIVAMTVRLADHLKERLS